LGQQPAGRRGEMQCVGASIGAMSASLHEATVFELVDEANHGVAVDGHGVGELQSRLGLILFNRC
jgi:carbon monoxide dehydrogenase subunit G